MSLLLPLSQHVENLTKIDHYRTMYFCRICDLRLRLEEKGNILYLAF